MLKRAGWFGIAAVAVVALLAGCKSSSKRKSTSPPESPAPMHTNATPAVTHHPAPPGDSGDSMKPGILAWDATAKEYQAKAGETNAPFVFSLTNVSSGPVMIYDTSTSCDCTVADLPSKPWSLPPNGSGQIHASIKLHGKSGVLTNSIIVFTSKGNRRLNVKAIAP